MLGSFVEFYDMKFETTKDYKPVYENIFIFVREYFICRIDAARFRNKFMNGQSERFFGS